MANTGCITAPASLSYQGLPTGGSSTMPNNWMTLSVLLTSLSCKSASADTDLYKNYWRENASETFSYLKEPLAKETDRTESTEKLVKFTRDEYLERQVVKVGENIYVAIGWALANSIMIEGEDGIIIIDTTESHESMEEIMAEFRKITQKPVKAIILTHFHSDHILGTNAVLEGERARGSESKIEIFSHTLTNEKMVGFSDTYDIGLKRGVRQFGPLISRVAGSITGSGIGPMLRIGKKIFLDIPKPTVTYEDRKKFVAAGVEFELIFTPGETSDQTTVWLPKERAVFPGDNIYKAFPNLYAIRGSPARDAKKWYQSLDRTRELGAKYLVGSHGKPMVGEQAVFHTLLIYRDAIKFVHDQTVRLLNKGYFPNQIVEMIQLPDIIADHPYLQEHYGTVSWSIRGIFTNYLGWFGGDPKYLNPMSESERGTRMLRLVSYAQKHGGNPAEIMLQEAQLSHQKSHDSYIVTGKRLVNEDKWALEVVDALLEMNSLNDELKKVATHIKISALRALGNEQISANGRNYYLTYAMETESGTGMSMPHSKAARAYVVKESKVLRVLEMICARVDGLKCQYENFTVELTFTDLNEDYTMTLRNSVCDVFRGTPITTPSQIHLSTTSQVFKSIKAGKLDFDNEVTAGNFEFLSGSSVFYKRFISCFDPVSDVYF